MKKTLLLFFVLLIAGVSGAWATDVTVGPSTGAYWKNGAATSDPWAPQWKSTVTGSGTTPLLVFTSETGMNTATGDIYSNQSYTLAAADGYMIVSYTFNGTATDGDVTITPSGKSATTITSGSSLDSPLAVTVGANSTTFALSDAGHITNLDLVVTITATPPSLVAGKTFTMQCARGYVYYNGSALKGTSTEASASKFAIVTYNTETYLYDVTQSKFVCHTELNHTGSTGNAALESNSDFSKAVKNISFGSTGIDAYPYYVAEDVYNTWLNMDTGPSVYFNTWTNFEGGNGGNTYKIEIVDDDFDDTEALNKLRIYFNPVYYVISDAKGEVQTTAPQPVSIGETITSFPEELKRPFCSYSTINHTVVSGRNDIAVTVSYNLPFETDNDKLYYATLRGHYVYYNATNNDVRTNQTSRETISAYKWSFYGDPYRGIKVKNAQTGTYLDNTSSTVQLSAEGYGWTIHRLNNTSTFGLYNGSSHINEQNHSNHNLIYWWAFETDAGSQWTVEDADASDKALLFSTITEAQALVAHPGVLGYPSTEGATTLSDAITTAQGVYDNPSGDYVSAYNTLSAAIATAKETISYIPRTDVYYTITSARGSMIYDSSHDEDEDAEGNKFLWYTTSLDNTNVNHLWGFIEQDGHYYMYNVGKQQFATVSTSGSYQLNDKGTWVFSDTPAYVTFDQGINNSVPAPYVRVRATVATTSTTYSMSISTSYTGPVITYDAQGDGGIPMTLAESSVAVDATITANMTNKVDNPAPYRAALKDVIDGCASLPIGSGLNQYASNSTYTDALAAANTTYDNASATRSELQEAQAALESAIAGLAINIPATGKFYRIQGATSGKYLAAGIANSKYAMTNATDATTIFYYDGDKKLTNLGSGMCNGVSSSSWNWVVGTSASTVTFCDGHTSGGYGIQSSDIYFYDSGSNADRGGNVDMTSENVRYRSWYLTEVTTLPITIGSTTYATLFAPVALTIPTNVKAYYINSLTEKVAELTEISTTIPANTPVILKATAANTYDFVATTGGTDVSASNKLSGSAVAVTIADDEAYTLQLNVAGTTVGLFPKAAGTLAGFKAYLPASEIPSGASVKGFVFNFQDADGISTVVKDPFTMENGTIYNLAGQRINKLQKGVNIVNGKKVLVK